MKDHFRELSRRFYFWVAFFVIGSTVSYLNNPVLLKWLIAPLRQPLFYTSPIGGFEAVFSVSTIFGFIFSLPILIYQIIKFVEPASTKLKNQNLTTYLITACVLALAGTGVSYYLVFPATLSFLNTFGYSQLQSLISTKDYFSFISKYLVGFAILFQFPLVIYIVSLFIDITPAKLWSYYRYVFVFSFILAAILTPTPDFLNQTIMAIPLILLYFVSILILYIKKHTVKQP